MITKFDMFFICAISITFTTVVYLALELQSQSEKELEFIKSADCQSLIAFIKDGLINGSKITQQTAESYYLIECQEKQSKKANQS